VSLERNAHKDTSFKEILMVLPQTWQSLIHPSDRRQPFCVRLEVVLPGLAVHQRTCHVRTSSRIPRTAIRLGPRRGHIGE
jgi:hypothetical protein